MIDMKSLSKILVIVCAFAALLYVSPWKYWFGECLVLFMAMGYKVARHFEEI